MLALPDALRSSNGESVACGDVSEAIRGADDQLLELVIAGQEAERCVWGILRSLLDLL